MAAPDIGGHLSALIALLLSRAYTDARHLERYTHAERRKWQPELDAVTGSTGNPGPVMPREWLARFPTMRNLWRDAGERLPSVHFVAGSDALLDSHVSVFEHQFLIEGRRYRTAFVEDVATDPLALGRGIASRLLRLAETYARATGFDMMGLSTAIPDFYQRLGWQAWHGPVAFRTPEGGSVANDGTMVLPLSSEGGRVFARHRSAPLQGGLREGK